VAAAKEGYSGDAFYVSGDGHFVGDDGFTVPCDFGEFYERFPNYVRNWVKKRLYSHASDEDIEDWAQDLLIHLQFLPSESKHREAGKKDVIQTFDPFKQYGASERRFRNYINFCLGNKFRTVGSKFSRNPLSHRDNMSFTCEDEGENDMQGPNASSEYVYKHSAWLSKGSQRLFKKQEDRILASEFIDFVAGREPSVAPFLHAVEEAGGSFADARRFWCMTCQGLANTVAIRSGLHEGHAIGIDQKLFNRFRNKVRELAARVAERKGS